MRLKLGPCMESNFDLESTMLYQLSDPVTSSKTFPLIENPDTSLSVICLSLFLLSAMRMLFSNSGVNAELYRFM